MEPKYLVKTKEKYDSLTKGLKKVADNLLADPMTFAIHPAKQSGKIIGVSETMIIRFCNEIGYKGFKDFQYDVREYLLNNMQDVTTSTNEKYEHPLVKSMTLDMMNLKRNIEHIDVTLIEQVVDMIMENKKRVIVGHYHSFSYAHWLSFNLQYLIGETILYRAEEDFQLIEKLPEDSIVITFSFFRYAIETIKIAEKAKKRGLTVIAITDTSVAPIVEYADVVIPLVFTGNRGTIHKSPITMSILNAILFEVVQVLDKEGNENNVSMENYNYYISEDE